MQGDSWAFRGPTMTNRQKNDDQLKDQPGQPLSATTHRAEVGALPLGGVLALRTVTRYTT
jgi:hypothetical protein